MRKTFVSTKTTNKNIQKLSLNPHYYFMCEYSEQHHSCLFDCSKELDTLKTLWTNLKFKLPRYSTDYEQQMEKLWRFRLFLCPL